MVTSGFYRGSGFWRLGQNRLDRQQSVVSTTMAMMRDVLLVAHRLGPTDGPAPAAADGNHGKTLNP